MISSNRIALRVLFIISSLAVCVAICAYHGISGRERIIHLTEQMIQDGKLTARFWKVQACRQNLVTLSKYGYRINLDGSRVQNLNPGDKVSFIARKSENEDFFWFPEKVHVHGTSTLKFWISGIAVLFVLLKFRLHFEFKRDSWSLIFRRN